MTANPIPAPVSRNTGAPLTKDDLIGYFSAGSKQEQKIGVEFERFAFDIKTLKPIPYAGEKSISALFQNLAQQFDWKPVEENGVIVSLQRGKQSITLEPGGQFELSGSPLPTVHHCCQEVRTHIRETKQIGDALGIDFLGIGFNPKWKRDDFPWMPKQRYDIMRAYMPKRGALGLDMMQRTTTVQVNLDYKSERDMVEKMRIGLALQPIVGALFSNSPFTEGKVNGFQSYRNNIWLDTDPDRTGSLPFAFDDGMGFERYVDYLLDVPMYFVYRDGKYIDASGQSFRDFMIGKLPALPGEIATIEDWIQHATCTFPNVRLKQWLEMRGADGGDWDSLCALPAFWVGLIYDPTAQQAALDLIRGWTLEDRRMMQYETPKTGLRTKFRNGCLLDIAREAVTIAEAGLNRRNARDKNGQNETYFLAALKEIVTTGKSPSDWLLEKFNGPWNGSVDPVFAEKTWAD